MEDILKSGFINLSAIAVLLYPQKTRAGAAAKLTAKIKHQHGQSLSDSEREQIIKIVHDFSIKLYVSNTKTYFNEATHITPEIYKQIAKRLTRKGQSEAIVHIDFNAAETKTMDYLKEFISKGSDKPRKSYKDNPRKQIDQLENNKYL